MPPPSLLLSLQASFPQQSTSWPPSRFLGFLAVLLFSFLSVSAENTSIPKSWQGVEGKTYTPFNQDPPQISVLIFVMPDCPISNQYQPRIRALQKIYSPHGIQFYCVYSDPEVTESIARKHAQDYAIQARIVLDPSQALARTSGAIYSPEAVVLSPSGSVVYRGRIDNWYERLGVRRQIITDHNLVNVLDNLLKGEPGPFPFTRAAGCYLPFPPSSDLSPSEKLP